MPELKPGALCLVARTYPGTAETVQEPCGQCQATVFIAQDIWDRLPADLPMVVLCQSCYRQGVPVPKREAS